MTGRFIKNIAVGQVVDLAGLVDYQPGRVVSLTMVQNQAVSMTLFAFAAGEGISAHAAAGDAWLYVLDGQAGVTIGKESHQLTAGQAIVMPAGVPHSVDSLQPFKMLLVVVRQQGRSEAG
ncbi:MAG: cupin domain-containing protein [Negativicutes bacterium]|nr:cupin domain-containing protein [Negativicutes bacterium]